MVDCAAILAGGLGTRLRSVVNDRPKVMARVADQPFITYILHQLATFGIQKVVLCTGFMADLIKEQLGDTYCGMKLLYSVEDTPLGTGGALRHASELLSGDTLLVMNGDSYCDCTLSCFAAGLTSSGSGTGMVLAHVHDVSRFGAVQLHENGRVESFVEKGGQTGPGWINAGIYLLPVNLIRELTPGVMISLEREFIPPLITDGIYGHRCSGSFIDIGIPEEFARAQSFFSSDKRGSV